MIKKKPHITIKNHFQKRNEKYFDILTPEILQDVSKQVTRCTGFTVEFDDEGYNKGRLAKIEYNEEITYVSFSETGRIVARNSTLQSFPSALIEYYLEKNPKKRICFYFLSPNGNIETDYLMYNYRLMETLDVEFLNPEKVLTQTITPFSHVNDIIANKEKIRGQNIGNNSTYITKSKEEIEIYAKTYGASKYESVLLCLATSRLAGKAKLYEILEQNLKELPKLSRNVIQSLGNVEIIPTDFTMEKKYLSDRASLRSPRFNFNLGNKFGAKKCAFCEINIPEAIAGAHIWPVSDIKQKPDLSYVEKLVCATDGENGIWLCHTHHKLFDINYIRINENGELKYLSTLDEKIIKSIKKNALITKISKEIVTEKFLKYLKERNKLIPEINYISL